MMKQFLGIAGTLIATGVASASITIVPTNTAFTDISVSGTALAGIGDDTEINVTGAQLNGAGWAGNELLAGGVSIRIGNNGCVIWGNAVADAFTNATEVGWANPNPTNPSSANIATMVADNG